MNKNFYDMVKYWTISDYKTPGTKAGVILDMLISEFIEALLSFELQEEEVTLLAKDFPVDINKGELNAKVDYLVCVDRKKLVLVELKTDDESYGKLQKERMENVKKAARQSLSNFTRILPKIRPKKNTDILWKCTIGIWTIGGLKRRIFPRSIICTSSSRTAMK